MNFCKEFGILSECHVRVVQIEVGVGNNLCKETGWDSKSTLTIVFWVVENSNIFYVHPGSTRGNDSNMRFA